MIKHELLVIVFKTLSFILKLPGDGLTLQKKFWLIFLYKFLTCAMNMKKYKLKRVTEKQFFKLANSLKSKDFLGDIGTCALISCGDFLPDDIGETYIFLHPLSFLQNGCGMRMLQVLPNEDIDDSNIYVKEDIYFNICNSLGLNYRNKNNDVLASLEKIDINELPVANSLKIAPISAACELSAQHENELLSIFFATPRYLHIGDIFGVSLGFFAKHLKASPSYNQIDYCYYKAISIEPNYGNLSKGFFVVKGHSELVCLPHVPSYVPSIDEKLVGNEADAKIVSIVSPDLSVYCSELVSLITPFLNESNLEIEPMFLLTGVNGSGKMETIKSVSNILGVHLMVVDCYEFYGVGMAAVEAKYDAVFARAKKLAPCLLTFTSIELLGRDKNHKEDVRLVSSFLKRASAGPKESAAPVILIGVSNCKQDELIANIVRAFVKVIKFKAPKPEDAITTLSWMALDYGFDVQRDDLDPLTKKVTAYVHGDLELLTRHALRLMHEENDSKLNINHYERGLEIMEAAYADTIGAAKVPNVQWDDIGGLSDLKNEISLTLNMPLQRPDLVTSTLRRTGILLYGPPGTGKTLMAKAVATECAMNFLSVKGPELMNMYVGQSERNVREVFERGREAAPCIIFFDELDSLAPNRGKSGDSGGVTDRVVSQLLAEMDGLQSNRGLFVIAATNRPDLVDPALLRPGRFDKMFYLGPCEDVLSKLSVLLALTKKFHLSEDVDLRAIAELIPECVTGADIYSVCSNAWLSAARRNIAQIQKGNKVELPLEVTYADFEKGASEMVPSLKADDLDYYKQLSASTAGLR